MPGRRDIGRVEDDPQRWQWARAWWRAVADLGDQAAFEALRSLAHAAGEPALARQGVDGARAKGLVDRVLGEMLARASAGAGRAHADPRRSFVRALRAAVAADEWRQLVADIASAPHPREHPAWGRLLVLAAQYAEDLVHSELPAGDGPDLVQLAFDLTIAEHAAQREFRREYARVLSLRLGVPAVALRRPRDLAHRWRWFMAGVAARHTGATSELEQLAAIDAAQVERQIARRWAKAEGGRGTASPAAVERARALVTSRLTVAERAALVRTALEHAMAADWPRNPRALFRKILTNCIRDWRRRSAKTVTRDERTEDGHCGDAGPWRVVVERIMQEMTERDRRIVTAKLAREPSKSVAELEGTSPANVDKVYSRFLGTIRFVETDEDDRDVTLACALGEDRSAVARRHGRSRGSVDATVDRHRSEVALFEFGVRWQKAAVLSAVQQRLVAAAESGAGRETISERFGIRLEDLERVLSRVLRLHVASRLSVRDRSLLLLVSERDDLEIAVRTFNERKRTERAQLDEVRRKQGKTPIAGPVEQTSRDALVVLIAAVRARLLGLGLADCAVPPVVEAAPAEKRVLE